MSAHKGVGGRAEGGHFKMVSEVQRRNIGGALAP